MPRPYTKGNSPRFQRTSDILAALRKDPGATFTSIAAQFNVSREWVRQVAGAYDLPSGHDRDAKRRGQMQEQQFTEILKTWEFVPKLKRGGFTLVPVMVGMSNPGQYKPSSKRLVINGFRCEVRNAYTTASVLAHWSNTYVHINGRRGMAVTRWQLDFILYRLPETCAVHGWLVLPIDKVPETTKVMRVGPINPKFAHRAGDIAPWPKYVDAWNQLDRTAYEESEEGE